MKVKKGSWVRIHNVILKKGERADSVPNDTKGVDLEMWTKGILTDDANIGDNVEVVTLTDRKICGTLMEVNPSYSHSFGKFIPELLKVGINLKKMLNK